MKSCLIVDDSRVVRKVTRHMAEDLGFECSEAEDGEKALESCRTSMPDVILVDWNMPVMGGLSFTEKLRASEAGRVPKVIFCSTENDVQSIKTALDKGADEYIMKPFDRDILLSKLIHTGLIDPLESIPMQ